MYAAAYYTRVQAETRHDDSLAAADQLMLEKKKYSPVIQVQRDIKVTTDARTFVLSTEVDWTSYAYAIQAVLQPPPNSFGAKLQPLAQNAIQAFDAGPAIDADHVEVDPVAALQICRRKQMAHQGLEVDPVGARHNHEARGIFVV